MSCVGVVYGCGDGVDGYKGQGDKFVDDGVFVEKLVDFL